MPRQPEVHFRLKPADKNGKASIFLDFAYNGRRLFYSFGQTVRPADWSDARERVKKKNATTDDGKYALNDLLDNLKRICEKTYNESLKDGVPEPEVLRAALVDFFYQNHAEGTQARPSLFSLAQRFINGEIKNRGKDKSKASLGNYHAVTKHLKEFQEQTRYRVDFDTVNLDFFYKYVTFLEKKKQLSTNTIAKDISILKVFMGEGVDLGYTNNMQFRHKKFSYNEVETESVYLNEQELNRLYRFDTGNKKLEQVKDLFIFGALVGLRFSDYSNVKPENIVKNGEGYDIAIKTQKTGTEVIIPCDPMVMEIFKKYESSRNMLPRSISNQKFNKYIKEVCRLAGFTETGRLRSTPDVELCDAISSHTCRRSFATNLYNQGFPAINLMKITGHKTEKSFLKYIKISQQETAQKLREHHNKRLSESKLRVA